MTYDDFARSRGELRITPFGGRMRCELRVDPSGNGGMPVFAVLVVDAHERVANILTVMFEALARAETAIEAETCATSLN